MKGFYVLMMPSLYAAARLLGANLSVALALQATLLASPYCLNYDMTAMSAALVVVMLGREKLSGRWALWFAGAWVAPALVMIANAFGAPIVPAIVAGMFLTLLQRSREPRTAGHSSVFHRVEPQPSLG
jgi:hypothetical protein